MAVLSLYDSNNCIETGFELAGFEITTLTDAESVVSGVIGPYERVAEFVNELKTKTRILCRHRRLYGRGN